MHGNDAGEVNMRLIVHMGLHKTGSTYLQHIFNDNHEALLGRGVYYQKQPGYPAHHFGAWDILRGDTSRSEEHTSELQSLMRISYAVFCLKKNKNTNKHSDNRKISINNEQTQLK